MHAIDLKSFVDVEVVVVSMHVHQLSVFCV